MYILSQGLIICRTLNCLLQKKIIVCAIQRMEKNLINKTIKIFKFKDFLIKKGLITTLRITRGDAIDGACGQLVGKLKKSIKGKNKTTSINVINTS